MVTIDAPIEADALRLRHEFIALPGLKLTLSQTARLLDVRVHHAELLLDVLVEEQFLIRTPDGMYRRRHPLTA